MYYPAGFAYVYAFLQLVSQGDVRIIIMIHIGLSVFLTVATVTLFMPFMRQQDHIFFILIPIFAQNIYRFAVCISVD
jgi:hypothetical protein